MTIWKKVYEILGDRNLFWKNYVEKLLAIYLSVYLYVCAYIVLLMKCIIIQGGPEVTLGLWNWIERVIIDNVKKKKVHEILGDRNLFWKNDVEKLPAIYLSVYLYVCAHVLFCVLL